MANAETKYALKGTKGKDGVLKVALIPASEAGEGAKLYTAPQAIVAIRKAGREVPFWDANGRTISDLRDSDTVEYRLNRWKKAYIGIKGSGAGPKEEVWL